MTVLMGNDRGRRSTATQVKAVVVNHGSFVEEGDVAGVKQPTMLNGSDNDQQISREQLDTFASILTRKAGMESDVKVCRLSLCRCCCGPRDCCQSNGTSLCRHCHCHSCRARHRAGPCCRERTSLLQAKLTL